MSIVIETPGTEIVRFHGRAVGETPEILVVLRRAEEGEQADTYAIVVTQWGLPSITNNLHLHQAHELFRHYSDMYLSDAMP